MSDNTRLFVALVLSLLAIFAWDQFYVSPKMEKAKLIKAEREATQQVISPVSSGGVIQNTPVEDDIITPQSRDIEAVNSKIDSSIDGTLKPQTLPITRDEALEKTASDRVKISTEKLHGSISLIGGVIDDLTLAEFHEEIDEDGNEMGGEVVLLSPRGTTDQYFIDTSWVVSSNVQAPTSKSIWVVDSGDVLTPTTPVQISHTNPQGIKFVKTFTIDDKYLISVKQKLQNNSAFNISAAPFGLINRTDNNSEKFFVSHEGMIAVTDEILKETRYESLKDEPSEKFSNVSGWIAIGDKYWLTSIIPQNANTDKFDISFKHYYKNDIDRYQNDILASAKTIPMGTEFEYGFDIFAGAKKLDYLEDYSEKLNLPLFDRTIDFGSLYFMTKPIFQLLNYFYGIVGNMGVAILVLTICIRIVLFPLANKSYKSMARLRKHTPEIQKIRERNKNNKQKQGQDMMKYYKSHKINPAAGCLPILVQIPVFFALYKVLYVTIEMRHKPFIWFIEDLSEKDPTNIFTLFGLIPWEVPSLIPEVGILPILFSFSMFIQQKLNPSVQDETQKIIMTWMPWIFLFIFSGFASGLVLYWVFNNILSIIQQYIITRKIEEDKNE